MEEENIINISKYSVIKPLYKTKSGELLLVSNKSNENDNDNILYIMKRIKVKSKEEKEMILNEVKKLKELNSKYILKIHDFFVQNDEKNELICLILDYSEEHKSLYELIYNSYFLTLQNIWRIFIKLLIGINSIHKAKILIINLNPQNIIIDKEKNIKITGFGNILDLAKEEHDNNLYNSPEVINEKKFDNKSDMWSLGCILYEMVCKRKIFENVNDIININYKIPEKIYPNITTVIEKLICKRDNIFEADKMIYTPIIKKKILEENLFLEIIQNNYEGKKINIYNF
jgi:NIMA (never in mitosis gene a)-related kinase